MRFPVNVFVGGTLFEAYLALLRKGSFSS